MAANPLFFCRTVAPGLFDKPFGAFHRSLADDIINPKKKMTVIAIARKHGKSTFIDVGVVLWLILHREVQFVIIAGATQKDARRFVGHIKSIVKSKQFVKYYGDLTQLKDDDQWTKDTINLRGEFEKGRVLHARIDAMGAGQAMPGQNVSLLNKDGVPTAIRPQVIIGDDLENQLTVLNTENADKLESWANQAVLPALHDQNSRFFVIGTPYASECYLTRVLNYKSGVTVIKYPFEIDGPDKERLSKKLNLPIGSPLWPEYYSRADVQGTKDFYYNNNDVRSYLLQYQLDTTAGEVWRFNQDDIEGARYMLSDIADKPLRFVLTADFAYTTKKHSDKSAIALCAWDDNGHIYVISATEGKWGDVETANKIAEIADQYKHIVPGSLPVYIETQSFGAVGYLVRGALDRKNVSYSLDKLVPGNRPKENRIKPLIPVTQVRRLHLPADGGTDQLEKQMWKFNGLAQAKNDDLLDALAYQLDVGYAADKPRETGVNSPENIAAWERLCKSLDRPSLSNYKPYGGPPRIRRGGLGRAEARYF